MTTTQDGDPPQRNQLGPQWMETQEYDDDDATGVDDEDGHARPTKKTKLKYGEGFDVIIVQGPDGTLYENSDFLVSFKGEKDQGGYLPHELEEQHKVVVLAVEPSSVTEEEEGRDAATAPLACHDNPKLWFQIHKGGTLETEETYRDAKQAALQTLQRVLRPGRNPIRYLLLDQPTKQVVGIAHASIYLWQYHDAIIVSDIDGTITKSNFKGLFGTVATKQYNKVTHAGICQLLTTLCSRSNRSSSSSSAATTPSSSATTTTAHRPQTHVLYLTSRPTLLANETRQLLVDLRQDQNVGLPAGPLLGFGGKVRNVIKMELLTHSANEFKAKKLWQQLIVPFREAATTAADPERETTAYPHFVAGFGNNPRDIQAYHAIGIDFHQLFMIDKKSKLVTFDKTLATASSRPEDENYNDAVTPADEQFQFRTETYYKERIGTEFAHGYTDRKLQYHFGLYGHEDEDTKAKLAKYLKVDLTSENDTDKKQFEEKRKEHYKEETPYVEN